MHGSEPEVVAALTVYLLYSQRLSRRRDETKPSLARFRTAISDFPLSKQASKQASIGSQGGKDSLAWISSCAMTIRKKGRYANDKWLLLLCRDGPEPHFLCSIRDWSRIAGFCYPAQLSFQTFMYLRNKEAQ